MAACCIIGCKNKAQAKRGKVKFYTIPTAKSSRPNKVRRRQLWVEAIATANGSTAGLKNDAQVCSSHFISGQMSLEESDPDFVPSLFPKLPDKKRKETLRSRPEVLTEAAKVTPKTQPVQKQAKTSEDASQFNTVDFKEINYCEPLEDEVLMEGAEEDASKMSSKLVTTTPTRLSTSQEAKESTQLPPARVNANTPIEIPPEYPPLKKPKLELKSVFSRLTLFKCEVCDGNFSSGTMLVQHMRLHDQKCADDESRSSLSEKVLEEPDLADKPVPVEELPFNCNMCDRSFPTTHSLKRHKLLHVRDTRKCKQCGTMFCMRHNHVATAPQISTENYFESNTTKESTIQAVTESRVLEISRRADDVDKSFNLLLKNETQDAITTAQDQSLGGIEQKFEPVTINPCKTGVLTEFKSYLTTSATVLEPTATQMMADPSIKPVPIIPCDNISTPQPLLVITKPSQPTQQQTVCLSFSEPMPSNLVKDFVSVIGKNISSDSTGTRLITFSSKPVCTAAAESPKQGPQLNRILSQMKPNPASLSIQIPLLPVNPPITSIRQYQNILPLPPKPPLLLRPLFVAPVSSSTNISPEKPKPSASSSTKCSPEKPKPSASSSTKISPEKPKPSAKKTSKAKSTPLHVKSFKKYIHGSRPPSPEPIFSKIQSGPWDSPFPDYAKDFIQPHLPQTPELPPSLQMFSPQFLTSSFLHVKRNYDYILSK